MLASILRAAGYRTGLYTQPHLHTYRERIQIDGQLISEDEMAAAISCMRPQVELLARAQPELGALTTFEVTTGLALDFFSRSSVDIAVIEIGLGGRLDATNVVDAKLAVITSISFDHMAVLGHTLPEIGAEKAGIIKQGKPALSAPQRDEVRPVLQRAADERGATFGIGGRDWGWRGRRNDFSVWAMPRAGLWSMPWSHVGLRVPLIGAHQLENAATAIAAAEVLRERISLQVSHQAIAAGLSSVEWPGRMEVIRNKEAPIILIDGAHNGDSAEKLAAALPQEFNYERLWLILGVLVDKDFCRIIQPFAEIAAWVWTVSSRHPRSRSALELANLLGKFGINATPESNMAEAIQRACENACARDLICITGSLSVAAEAREALGLVDSRSHDPRVL